MGFLGKNTGVGCHFLLQRIFPTQGLNTCCLLLLHCRQILYHWVTLEAPRRHQTFSNYTLCFFFFNQTELKISFHIKTYTWTFIPSLFITDKTWKSSFIFAFIAYVLCHIHEIFAKTNIKNPFPSEFNGCKISIILSLVCAQSCTIIWDQMNCIPWCSSVHRIIPARILEWVVISHFRGSSWGLNPCLLHFLVDSLPLSHLGSWLNYIRWFNNSRDLLYDMVPTVNTVVLWSSKYGTTAN